VRTVLVAEPDADLREVFRLALTFAGFEVREASSGIEALHMLESPPDLVVLDPGLPIMTGDHVQQQIATQAHLRHIPVVIVTSHRMAAETLRDVACVLQKPVLPEDLVKTVRRHLP
jgi:CheY-like chemotaxis protein